MNDFDEKFDSRTNESLAQIEATMKSMVSMAKSGHFPFLKAHKDERKSVLDHMITLPLLSPHKSKKILYNSLKKCRRHQCFQRKMTIVENFSFDEKSHLVKALVTLAEDSSISDDFIIH